MAKQSIRNAARGPRVVNRRLDKDHVEQVYLVPGQVLEDFEPANPEDRAFRAMVDGGDLVLGDKEPPEVDQEEAFRNSPRQAQERMVATMAGNTEGYADPHPEVEDRAQARRDAELAGGRMTAEQVEEAPPAVAGEEAPSRRRKGHKPD
jgi:hypothetical protein